MNEKVLGIILNEKVLMKEGYRKYTGEAIDIFFNTNICIHSARCVKGNPDVFDTKRRPWILPDNANKAEVSQVIDTCPSGALQYIYKG